MAKRTFRINFDKHDHQRAEAEARVLGISFAEYVRCAILQALPAQTDPPWMRYAGFVGSKNVGGPRAPVDDIVYINNR